MRDDGSVPSPEGSVRERAVQCSASGEVVDLAEVWRALRLGKTRIVDSFHTDDRCFLLLTVKGESDAEEPLNRRNTEILEGLLSGNGNKVLASELGASESTISSLLKRSARQLGLTFRVSNMPTLLMMAAYAARRGVRIEGHRAHLVSRGRNLVAVSAARPERALSERVSAAEYAVAQLLVEGHPYSRIAALRGTSTRTVANQLSAVFKKLEVSGRSQLMVTLLSRAPGRPAPHHAVPSPAT